MINLTTTQLVLHGPAPVRDALQTQTVQAVRETSKADMARGDSPGDRTSEAERAAREARTTGADPDAPTGPPPAFEANVLEAERARLRESELEQARKLQSDQKAEDADTSKEAPQPDSTGDSSEAATAYRGASEDPPVRKLDLSR